MKYVSYLALAVFLVRYPPLRRLLSEVSKNQRRVIVGLVSLILFAQTIGTKYESYPFVKWGMYSGFGPETVFYEYRGVRTDGSETDFPLAHLLRIYQPLCPTCGKRLTWKLKDLGGIRRGGETAEERAAAARLYDETLRSAWADYQSRNPEFELAAVRVWINRYNADEYTDVSSIERSFAWQIELD